VTRTLERGINKAGFTTETATHHTAFFELLSRGAPDIVVLDLMMPGLDGVQALGDQLDIIFNRMSVAGFDLVQATPNAQDIIEGFNAIGQRELEASAEKFRAVIERILSPHEAALLRSGLTAIGLSDFVQRSAKAASSDARDRDHLIGQLNTLKTLCQVATATDAASLNTMV